VKIGFILSSSARNPLASTRVAVLNIIPYLQAAGHDAHILFESTIATERPSLDLDPDQIVRDGFQIVCFQKVAGPAAIALMHALKQRGVKTAALYCDYVYAEEARAADITFVVTDYLRSLYPEDLQAKVHVVHDGIEYPDERKSHWRADRGSPRDRLHAVLVVGSQLNEIPVLVSPPSWLKVTLVGVYPASGSLQRLRDLRYRFAIQGGWRGKLRFLRFVASPRIACVPWDPSTVYEHVRTADIGLIAFATPPEPDPRIGATRWAVKSENRLTLMMSVGLPVVATPIPAYEAIVSQGDNGFLVRTRGEWLEALERLRDPALRRRIGDRARASVIDRFSKEAQAALLLTHFQRLMNDR
jgi:glycosyltransferase involved in cell wall biosynthesis